MMESAQSLQFRTATQDDLVSIVEMLADDPLGKRREKFQQPLLQEYSQAFAAIEQDPNNEIIVACRDEAVVGFFQITYIPYLTYMGRWRALVEGVRVHRVHRGQGLGRQLLLKAIALAKEKECHLIQLTTDKTRPEAIAFYESLGFVASHEGMKLHFDRK